MVSEGLSAEAEDLPADIAEISRLADYHLEDRIGAGGMAVVFRARDERLQRQVALKVLAPSLAGDEAFRHRFIRESQAAAAVDDPHIIPVFEAGEAEGVLFLAMRYVPGGDVRALVRRAGPLSPAQALAIISPVASALGAAHSAGLVHRDVKLANILLDVRPGRPDHVYLSDFGLSKIMMSSLGPTRSGQFLGTPGYSAPEQLEGKPVDGRADQYSLACAAFELLCGQTPFPRDQVAAVIWAHISEPPPMVTSRRPGLPPAVDAVLAKALAKAPADRYGSCREFADALRAALGLEPYDSGSEPAERTYLPTQSGQLDDAVDSGLPGTLDDAADSRPPGTLHDAADSRPPEPPSAEHAEDGGRLDHRAARRRWPVATTILVVLLLVIVGGGYAAWRYTQGQYYVGTDGRQVIIYRGVNERVLGMSLSGVYQPTGIPLDHVPANDLAPVRSTITASSLAGAQKTVANIRQAWTCQRYAGAYQFWLAHKPAPKKVTHRGAGGKLVTTTVIPPYKAAPTVPNGCTPQGT